MIGMGYYGTHTPPVILRNVLENPGWYTAYTPYQAEVSQGRLEAVLNFQQMVVDLTGMELANASLLDEATAAAEAMAMAHRVRRSKSDRFFVDARLPPADPGRAAHPRRAIWASSWSSGDAWTELDGPGRVRRAGPVPGHRRRASATRARRSTPSTPQGGLAVVATDLLALTLLTPPGELGADIVLGSAQRFGVPMGYGGPHAAFFATKDAHKRAMPGRIIGVSVDARGQPALRMALQTREQHIRRDKATSNICTAQVLLAVMAGFYAVWHGPEGLTRIAAPRPRPDRAPGRRPCAQIGIAVANDTFFDTLTLDGARPRPRPVHRRPRRRHQPAPGRRRPSRPVARRDHHPRRPAPPAGRPGCRGRAHPGRCSSGVYDDAFIATDLARTSPFLTHPVFQLHRSETEMLRYLRRLQAKDIALDRAMIPLGSCTMKLNATAEMIPITWPEFANLHPFAPQDQAAGYQALFRDLEAWLKEITGFDAVSLQPNAGSQGEYAGLLAIRAWHDSRDDQRPRRLPDPVLRPRHQPRQRGHGRHAGGGGRLRRAGQRRPRRPRGQGHAAPGPPRRPDGHLPQHPRRVRGARSRTSAPSSTPMAARSTWTAPTSTRWSASPAPPSWAPTSAT